MLILNKAYPSSSTPARIEAAIQAASDERLERDQRVEALELALEQAHYEAERAFRQYDVVEPENRLVAGELESRWNEALIKVRDLEGELREARAARPAHKDVDLESLRQVAQQMAHVWNHPMADMALKKRIVRTLIQEIMVDVNEEEALVELMIHWSGGQHSLLKVSKAKTGQHRHTTDRKAVDLVRELSEITPDKNIASVLNRLRLKTGRGNTWTAGRVASLRNYHGIAAYSAEEHARRGLVNLQQAATCLGIGVMSVLRLIKKGIIQGSQVVPCAPWVIERKELEKEEVTKAVQWIKAGAKVPLPVPREQLTLEMTNT